MECGNMLQVRLEGVYVITAAFLHANNVRRKVSTANNMGDTVLLM